MGFLQAPFGDKPFRAFDPDKAFNAPLGAASPLWLAFMGAASAGVAFWWMTRWVRPFDLVTTTGVVIEPEPLPAIEPAPALDLVAEPLAAVVEEAPVAIPAVEAAVLTAPVPEAVADAPDIEAETSVVEPPAELAAVAPEPAPVVAAPPKAPKKPSAGPAAVIKTPPAAKVAKRVKAPIAEPTPPVEAAPPAPAAEAAPAVEPPPTPRLTPRKRPPASAARISARMKRRQHSDSDGKGPSKRR